MRFQSHATSARSLQRVSNLTGRLPGLVREILRIFSLFLRAVSCSRFRGSNVLVIARAPRLLWGVACSLQSDMKQSLPCPDTGHRIPLVRRGLRSALIRHTSSHNKTPRIVFFFFVRNGPNPQPAVEKGIFRVLHRCTYHVYDDTSYIQPSAKY